MANYREMLENKQEKKHKIIAVVSVAVVYVLMFVCFVFLGLTHQVPPPPEYGIEVDMSGGGGGGSSGSQDKVSTTKATSQTAQRISTQRTDATTAVPSGKEVQTKSEPAQTVNQRAMFTKRTQQGSGGEGTGQGIGKGSGIGPGEGSGSGGGIGSGQGIGEGDFWLDGRPVVKKAFPKSKNNLEGVVVVEFRADRNGNVIYAKAGVKGTTITDSDVWRECERAAKESKFKSKADAFAEEKGRISYRFEIQ